MKDRRKISTLIVAAVASLALCGGAQAAVVTVGPPPASIGSSSIGNSATLLNSSLGSLGGNLTSPVSGTIIRWRVTGFQGGPFRLRVLSPLGGTSYLGSGTSAPVTVGSPATQTFPTNLPIKAGQTIGVDNTNESDQVGVLTDPAASFTFFVPPLADGATGAGAPPTPGGVISFNADVLPVPGVSAVLPAKGSIRGGTEVAIGGQDFTEVSAVAFGSQPAASYTVLSDTSIRAVAPRVSRPGPVAVTVTTPAGVSPAGPAFTYTACVVPKLAGKKLKGAKKRIRKAGCKVGSVKFLGNATAKTGRVTKQRPQAGKVFAPGKKVRLTLDD